MQTGFIARSIPRIAILLDVMRVTDLTPALLFCCIIGCGGDLDDSASAGEVSASLVALSVRAEDEWAHELREAIEFGELKRARTLLELHMGSLGDEAELLSARLLTAEGADFDAQRAIERARRAAPNDVRVPATASEMHSAHGRTQSALEELKRAFELGGAAPEVHRARAVHMLSRSGRAADGLLHLELARAADPSLPFLDRAFAQAHLLIAKEHLGSNRLKEAMRAVELSYQHDPREFETRRLMADVLLAQKRVEDALVVMAELHAEGEPVLGELATMEKRTALVKLLKGEREAALDLFCSARSHGLSDEELGSGAQILVEAALKAIEEGTKAYESESFELSRGHFERAVELDPELLIAHNHLGVVCYKIGDDEAAIRHWQWVWNVAREEALVLPEAVEVNLAQAMVRAGKEESARRVLKESLAAAPEGPHAEKVRRFLEAEFED